eukprot:6975943-Karenia_brevis.AAC.1
MMNYLKLAATSIHDLHALGNRQVPLQVQRRADTIWIKTTICSWLRQGGGKKNWRSVLQTIKHTGVQERCQNALQEVPVHNRCAHAFQH